jgi:pimeloyl-ACP methyl ester carboxylesterase
MNGYMLMHGKNSGPRFPACSLIPVHAEMQKQGYLVDFAEHPCALNRVFKTTYESNIESVRAGVERLKAQGATRIHLVGHSIGANLALYYATLYNNFASLVLLAPAHNTHFAKFIQWSNWSREKARKLVEEGRGNELNDFVDINMTDAYIVQGTAVGYLSYYDPQGNSVMPKNARKILQPVNVYVGSGSADTTQMDVKKFVYDPIPNKTAASKFVQTGDTHLGVCLNLMPDWLAWTQNLSS